MSDNGYSALAIANEFIATAPENNCHDLSPMKLQKLVYFAHGWYLAIKKKPLISDKIEAWNYGPVIPSLYHELKHYGSEHIVAPVETQYVNFNNGSFNFKTSVARAGNPEVQELIKAVWKTFGSYSPIQLSNLSHAEGSPWHKINDTFNGHIPQSVQIPDNMTKSYFESMIV